MICELSPSFGKSYLIGKSADYALREDRDRKIIAVAPNWPLAVTQRQMHCRDAVKNRTTAFDPSYSKGIWYESHSELLAKWNGLAGIQKGKLIILLDEAHMFFNNEKFYDVDESGKFQTIFSRLENATWILFSGTYGGEACKTQLGNELGFHCLVETNELDESNYDKCSRFLHLKY